MRFSDFTIEKSFTSTNGDCYIGTSKIDRKKYFIKRLVDITYGSDSDSLELKKSYKKKADAWLTYHRNIRQSLTKLGNGTGNIVFPVSYFVDEGRVYEVAYYVPISPLSLEQISKLSSDEKLKIMQTSSFALKSIHSIDIVHFDLKPENIPISKSAMGGYISKITDCSDALFDTFNDDKKRPPQEQIVCTDAYWSPELALYKLGKTEAGKLISCKNDVFAMGLIFHEWWTGKFPNYEGRDDFISPYQIINDFWPNDIKVDSSVPAWLSMLIMDMLCPNPDYRPDMDKVFEAVKSRSYNSKIPGVISSKNTSKSKPSVDLTPIKEAFKRIPSDLGEYTEESVKNLSNFIQFTKEKFTSITTNEIVNKFANKIDSLIISLEKKPNQLPIEKIENLISTIKNKDLSRFTKESIDKLNNVIEIVINQKDRIVDEVTLNKVYNALLNAYKSLEIRNDFSIQVANPLPSPYTRIDILSEYEVVAHYGNGGKIRLSAENACKMKLITRK